MMLLFMYLIVLIFGFLIGYYFRKKNIKKPVYTNTIQLLMIYVNIVFMGIRIGIREEIINNIYTIGVFSLIFTIVILVFVVLVTSFGRKIFGFDKYGDRYKGKNFVNQKENILKQRIIDYKESKKNNSYVMTILILLCAIIGICIGYFIIFDGLQNKIICNGDIAVFEKYMSKIIDVVLCILILFVGVDLGYDKKTISNVKKTGWLIFLFPIFNIIGTTIGAIVSGFFCNMNILESLALGEGYSWFSLAPSILIKYGLLEIGAMSFLHNVLREILSIIFMPIVAKKIGYIECISLSGAAAMDDCLPIIEKCTTPLIAIYGFISGVLLTMLVPFITTFFANIVAG